MARKRHFLNYGIISFKPTTQSRGNVLAALHLEPFLEKTPNEISVHHTNLWENFQIVQIYLELGFAVDVIQWTNAHFRPHKEYVLFIGYHHKFDRLASMLDDNCAKVAHIDTAHWLYHMTAQHQRLLALQKRRNVTLNPYKIVPPNHAIENADCATILGNDFTIETFSYASTPIYRIPISSPRQWDWPADKDFAQCRRRFVWFGSSGLVHKGLDLVLEAFSQLSDYHLTVCGPVSPHSPESSFVELYQRQLFETPNIRTVGWIDINSTEFIEIANSCAAVIFPSCSEGGGGSVITCMHAGLIPIVTREASIDTDHFGLLLEVASIEAIKRAVIRVGEMSVDQLSNMARCAWQHVRVNHTREKFTEIYREVAEEIVLEYVRES